MTPGEANRVEQHLHEVEVRVTEQIATLGGKIDAALALRPWVGEHETRIRALEQAIAQARRLSWADIGAILVALAAAVTVAHFAWPV